jgi:hypothetical protein
MEYRKTNAYVSNSSEVVLNLWAYADELGYVMRLAGRAYVMDGDDSEKLALLRELAKTDFLSAVWQKVPARFKLNGPDGKEMHGVAHASMLSDENSHANLFGALIEMLAAGLPEQMRSVAGQYIHFTLELPQDPLSVTTIVMELDDGRLQPMISVR